MITGKDHKRELIKKEIAKLKQEGKTPVAISISLNFWGELDAEYYGNRPGLPKMMPGEITRNKEYCGLKLYIDHYDDSYDYKITSVD